MNVTYYGHACFSVEVEGKHLLFDPFIKQNPLARSIDVKKIKADYIILSHGHDDHVADAVKIAKRTDALVIANFEVGEWMQKKDVKRVHLMNPGGSYEFEFGTLKSVPAIHSSSMPDGSCGGSPSGFVIESGKGNFYYSGDTALTYDIKLIGESTKLDFAVLCIGNNFTMGVDDAIRAAEFVKCNQVMGVHYDTFPEIKLDQKSALKKFQAKGKQLHLLQIGETRALG